jgi:hypothetical protein
VIAAINFVDVVERPDEKIAENGRIPSGTDFGISVRVADLFTVALVLQ